MEFEKIIESDPKVLRSQIRIAKNQPLVYGEPYEPYDSMVREENEHRNVRLVEDRIHPNTWDGMTIGVDQEFFLKMVGGCPKKVDYQNFRSVKDAGYIYLWASFPELNGEDQEFFKVVDEFHQPYLNSAPDMHNATDLNDYGYEPIHNPDSWKFTLPKGQEVIKNDDKIILDEDLPVRIPDKSRIKLPAGIKIQSLKYEQLCFILSHDLVVSLYRC